MKVQVVFDETGKIHAMLRPLNQVRSSKENSENSPVAVLRPNHGQRLETLDIPADLQHLKPVELHNSIRVEVGKGSPRLVAKTK